MRVIMNGLAALKPKTGVGHYVARLHAAMRDVVTLYPGAAVERIVRQLPPRSGGHTSDSRTFFMQAKSAIGDTAKHLVKTAVGIHFAHHAHALGFDLYHEPNFIPFSTRLPTVITVHDLSVVLHPEWHPADRVRHHERHFLPAVRRADHIITVSHAMRQELIDEIGVAPERVTAIHNGIGDEFTPRHDHELQAIRRRFELPDRFFLIVGTIEPRKNVLTAMRAYVALPHEVQRMCPLVLAGPWGWKSEPERAFFDRARLTNPIRHLGYVSATELPQLYSAATALLYPSHYEGFGLPPVEMLACGGRVVASTNAAAVREVVGSYGTFLDARDDTAWTKAMRDCFETPTASRVNARRHAANFTWTRAANETMSVYRAVLRLPSTNFTQRAA